MLRKGRTPAACCGTTRLIAYASLRISHAFRLRRSAVIKFIGFIKRKDGMSLEDFSTYWRYKHAALIAATPGLRRYVQNHVVPESLAHHEPVADGSAQAWFEDMASFQAAIESDAWKAAVADAPNFIGSTIN